MSAPSAGAFETDERAVSATSSTQPTAVRPVPPPRDVTAAALVRGLAAAQRLIGPVSLVLALALIVEVTVQSGDTATFALLVLWWVPAFVMSLLLLVRPTVTVAVAVVVVGAIVGTGFVATLLQQHAEQQVRGLFLLESLAWALLFVGAVRPSPLDGLRWILIGWVSGTLSLMAGYGIAGRELVLSPDRLVDAVIVAVAYSVIAVGGRRRRDRVPELPDAALASRRQNAGRQRERAAAALVHDTVLASLTLIARSEGPLDERVRQGIRRDLDAVAMASATSVGVVSAAPAEGSFAARMLEIIDDLRWRGLRVDVSGPEVLPSTIGVADAAAEAVLAALRAALENVLSHARTDRAEVIVGRTPIALTVLVVDGGRGFDVDDVPDDRLGLRESIRGRLALVDGTARVWSNASGTTVMLSVPLALSDADLVGDGVAP